MLLSASIPVPTGAGVISAPKYCISSYKDFVAGVRGPNLQSFEYYFPSDGSIVLPPDLGHCIPQYGDGFQGALSQINCVFIFKSEYL